MCLSPQGLCAVMPCSDTSMMLWGQTPRPCTCLHASFHACCVVSLSQPRCAIRRCARVSILTTLFWQTGPRSLVINYTQQTKEKYMYSLVAGLSLLLVNTASYGIKGHQTMVTPTHNGYNGYTHPWHEAICVKVEQCTLCIRLNLI